MLAQGEIGAKIQEDPMMQQMLQADPQGAEIQIASMIANRIATLTLELAQSENMGKQDPLVMLKQRELDIKAMDLQRKADQDMMSNEIRENEIDEKLDIDILEISEEAQKIQEKKIKDLRKSRDSKSLNEEMEKLRNACKDNVNLVPYLISVAEKGGTVGEIVDVMKSVYGEWQESFGF